MTHFPWCRIMHVYYLPQFCLTSIIAFVRIFVGYLSTGCTMMAVNLAVMCFQEYRLCSWQGCHQFQPNKITLLWVLLHVFDVHADKLVYCSATVQSNATKNTAHARTLVGRQKGRWFCTCQCWCYHTGVFVRAKILKTRVRMVNSGPWQQCLTACHTMLYTTAKTREQKLVLHAPKKYWACCFFPTWLSARDGRDLLTHSLQKAQESVFS